MEKGGIIFMAKRQISEWARIERSREMRLWFTQVGIPVALAVGYIMSNEEARNWCESKIAQIKKKFSRSKVYEV